MTAMFSETRVAAGETEAGAGLEVALGSSRWRVRPSGAAWRAETGLLVVADLHLGKSERLARRGGALLPPYDTEETLRRLEAEVSALRPSGVICLGDSFDDGRAARELPASARARLGRMAAGRDWLWLAGNHDRAIADAGLPGRCAADAEIGGVAFRHIAADAPERPEMSGHFHPKATLWARGRRLQRRCALLDGKRLILAAFGAYTGGLDATDAAFDGLLGPEAQALLLCAGVVRSAPRRALSGRS